MSSQQGRVGGPCLKLGDHINSDVIIPGRYLTSIDPLELAQHAFEPLGPQMQARFRVSKVIVAGKNFGCGSAREQAASCLIGAGVNVVIAESFARVFFRNAINTAVVAVQCPAAVAAIHDGDEVFVDLDAGVVETNGTTFTFPSYPASLKKIVEVGGLIPYVAARLAVRAEPVQ